MRIMFQLFAFCFLLFAHVSAQPSFPSTPSQAPVTGLELLAIAGGAMAVKKLMGKNAS